MCNDPSKPIISVCACGAHYRDCDYLEAMLHITPQSSLNHKWVYLRGDSFVTGRDGITFDCHGQSVSRQILIYGEPLKKGE